MLFLFALSSSSIPYLRFFLRTAVRLRNRDSIFSNCGLGLHAAKPGPHPSCAVPGKFSDRRRCYYHENQGFESLSEAEKVDSSEYKQAWARLLAKIYEVDPFVCPVCGSEMKVIAVIQNPEEIKKILAHLVKVGRAPPGFDPSELN